MISFQQLVKAQKTLKNEIKFLHFFSKPSALTKKFWPYVKSNSNTSRISATVHRAKFIITAEFFNAFFYGQFSLLSNYQVAVHLLNDSSQQFKFEAQNLMHILENSYTNTSHRSDGISGAILKYCTHPLSILFNISCQLSPN